MKDLARGLLAPTILFSVLFLLGWVVISQTVDSAAVLDRSVTTAGPSTGNDPFAPGSEVTDSGQIETYLVDIADGLFQWIIVVTAAGAFSTIAWYLLSTNKQKRVVGPAGQSTAFVHWVICGFVYFGICAIAYFWLIEPLGINEYMDDTLFWAFVGLAAILGGFVYWIATAIAATPVMKPSVPFAARRARS